MNELFSWRRTKACDLQHCLKLHPAKNGAEIVGAERAYLAWQSLFSMSHAVRGAVVELYSGGESTIVGFGFAAFVRKSFIDAELRNPAPGLNARIIESVDAGNPVIATLQEVREANTRCDLQQVILDTSWDPARLTPEQVDEVRVLLGSAYYQQYAGYRFSRILSELVDARDLWHARGLTVFKIVHRFDSYQQAHPESTWNPDRALGQITSESMRADPHSIASSLFQHHQVPRFGFTAGEQELLESALDGMDDFGAARSLFVSVAAIKRRWATLFERVAAVRPDICPPDGEGTRGIQKRQRILAYVRSHPEELRPFDFTRVASKSA